MNFKQFLKESRVETRRKTIENIRAEVENVAQDAAHDYNNFELFRSRVMKYFPEASLKDSGVLIFPYRENAPIHIDIRWMFDNYNPHQLEKRAQYDKQNASRSERTSLKRGVDATLGKQNERP